LKIATKFASQTENPALSLALIGSRA